jgi:hypothetical protein
MNGLIISREEECAVEEEVGVLHSGKRFWYSRKMIVAEREEQHGEVEERDIGVVLQIKGISITKEKEKYCHLGPVEGDPSHPSSPTQAILCVHL